jgi:septal ring factor EnvC (AmiA/AmiB activator)
MSLIVETDIKEILEKIDRKFDAFAEKVERRLNSLEQDVSTIKTGITRLESDFKVANLKVDGIYKRLDNQEFTSRAILASLMLIVIGGFVKMYL